MISIEENINLKGHHTFGINVTARYFCRIRSESDFQDLIRNPLYQNERVLFLGGGSNVLFRTDFDGLVVKNELTGIEVLRQNDDEVVVEVASGENWHQLVMHCVDKGWGGIENLALIPGTVGAAPIQNIGAYGVEVKDVIENVSALSQSDGSKRLFTNEECRFGYRESVFKQQLKEKYFISSVTLTLTKKNHTLHTAYGAIQETLSRSTSKRPGIASVCDAVIQIRQSKLPDPAVIGNAGSFFKNPSISISLFDEIKKSYPLMPGYTIDNQYIKVPAGWLIEQCGWKGKKIEDAGVHAHQALVLVNYNNATGEEIFALSQQIIESVKKKFAIDLMTEVNIIS